MRLPGRRWLWLGLIVFLFPLSLVAGRFCSFAPTDEAYHGLVALHRVLPQIVISAAMLSVATVLYRIRMMRLRFKKLTALASDPPQALNDAFATEAERLSVAFPALVYIATKTPICFTASGWRGSNVFVSRGFVEDLDDLELRLVAHHEIVHMRDRDAGWNLFWHVVFAALVVPGFDGVERALRLRRESRANLSASRIDPLRYERLLVRGARERRSLCSEGRAERRPSGIALATAPIGVATFFIALVVSHADFMHDLPYLATHHC